MHAYNIYFYTGYVVLQNCETITPGIVAFPYAVLLGPFVYYFAYFQPPVGANIRIQ